MSNSIVLSITPCIDHDNIRYGTDICKLLQPINNRCYDKTLIIWLLRKHTYKSPNVQSNWKTKVHQHKENCCFELWYENANETSLEYVSVEEQQKDNNDSKENAHVLDAETVHNKQ